MESVYDTQALSQTKWEEDLLPNGWEPLLPPRDGIVYIRKYISGFIRSLNDWSVYDVNR